MKSAGISEDLFKKIPQRFSIILGKGDYFFSGTLETLIMILMAFAKKLLIFCSQNTVKWGIEKCSVFFLEMKALLLSVLVVEPH